MMLACVASAYAVSTPEEHVTVPQDMMTVLGEPIGTPDEEDGILIENRASTADGLPFTMTANRVSNFLTTYSSSGKNFSGGCFDALKGTGLKIEGTLTHSLGYNIKVGACYYEPSNDTFYSVYPGYFESGVECVWWIPKMGAGGMYLGNYTTYYGHITNHNKSGTVSGSLTFSVSTDPALD